MELGTKYKTKQQRLDPPKTKQQTDRTWSKTKVMEQNTKKQNKDLAQNKAKTNKGLDLEQKQQLGTKSKQRLRLKEIGENKKQDSD